MEDLIGYLGGEEDDLIDEDDDETVNQDFTIDFASELSQILQDGGNDDITDGQNSTTTTTTTTTEDGSEETTTTTTTTRASSLHEKRAASKKQQANFDIDNIAGLSKKKKVKKSTGPSQKGAFTTFKEVIKLAPKYTKSYTIMSLIMEEQGQKRNAMDLLYIGATMAGNDSDLWRRAGKASKQLDEMEQATYCFKRLTQLLPDDLEAQWDYTLCLVHQNKTVKALESLRKIYQQRPEDTTVVTELVHLLTRMEHVDEAISILSRTVNEEFKKPFDEVDLNLFNLLMELYLRIREFDRVDQVFQRIRGIIPDDLEIPVDLVSNAGLAYFNMGNEHMADLCFRQLLKADITQVADIYFQFAQKLQKLGIYPKALTLYQALLKSAEDGSYIYPHIGELYKSMGNYDLALKYISDAYQNDPQNKKLSILLSDIYKDLGDHERSLQILNQSDNNLDFAFLGIATALLHGTNDRIRFKSRIMLGTKSKVRRIKKKPAVISKSANQRAIVPFAECLSERDYHELIMNTCKVLSYYRRNTEASAYLRYISKNVKFNNQTYLSQLRFLLVGIGLNEERPCLAVRHIKFVCLKKPYSNRIWNLYNRAVITSKGDAHIKFLNSMLADYPKSVPMLLISGNIAKTVGHPRGAIHDYLRAFKLMPNEPLINLLLGITLLVESMGPKK
eukprot:gene6707-7800_t